VNKDLETFAKDYDFDPIEVAHATHGRRLYDTLKEYCRLNDEDELQVCASHSYASDLPLTSPDPAVFINLNCMICLH